MRTCHQKRINWVVMLFFCLYIISGVVFVAKATEISENIREMIVKRFPGAEIKEIREDMWKGTPVTEVEITTRDGIIYEIIISKNEEILKIEEEKELPLIGGELSLGAAVFAERDVYKGVDTEFQAVPFLRYENGPFEIQTQDGPNASFSFFRTEKFSVALIGDVSFEGGYDPDDSIYLKGMDELNSTYGVGLEWEMMFGNFETSIEVLHDISGEESGQEAELSLVYPRMIAGFEVRPGLNLTWMSKKKVDYLYGVSAREARLNRPVYNPGSSFEVGMEIMIQRPFFDNFTFVGLVEISKFGSEISNSPIVDEDLELGGALGVMYNF